MPEISTAQKYARIFRMPEEDIAHASYDIFTYILTVTYGIDKPRYKQKTVTKRATKEFADYFTAPLFMTSSVDQILTEYLKAKGMNFVVREGQRPANVYYTSTDPIFGKMTLRQFIETEVKERGNYTLADVQSWMRRYNISENDLAIWVSPKKWVANRYNLLAEEWDKAEFIPESEMNVYEIKGDEGFIIPESDDGDEGYLFVFKKNPNHVIREAANQGTAPGQHERANKIIEEIKASGLSPKEKRKKIGEGLKAMADGIDRSVYTAIRDFRPLGIMSEIGMLMGAQPRKGVRIDTPFGAYVFDNKRVPSKEMVDSWYAQHKEAETINTLAVEYAFGLEAIPNTVTGNFRVVEHARRLRAQGLLSPEEEQVLNALEKYWQEHPEFDRQKGYGIWGHNLEIMVPESLRKNTIEKKESLIEALLRIEPGKDIRIDYNDVPKGVGMVSLPPNLRGIVVERRGDFLVAAIQSDLIIVAYLFVQKGSQLIQIRPIPRQKTPTKAGEVNTIEYNMWVERIKKEAPEYLPEWEKIAINGTEAKQKPEVLQETTTAGIRAGDTIIHKTAKYTAVVDKVYKNGNAEITVLEAKGIPEWEKSIKEGFPIKTTVKGVDIDRYFEKVLSRLAEEQKPVIKGTEAKQPWEMTYREFANFFEEVWSGQRFTFAERVGKSLGIQSQAGEPYHMIKGRRIGYSGGLSRDRWRLAIVDKALSEGKKVPEEVLAELSESLKKEKEKLGGTVMAESQEGKPLSQEEIEKRFRALLKEGKEKGFIEQEQGWIDRFNDPARSKENTILDLEGLIKTMEKRTPPAAVGSPYEIKATMSFIPRERVWSIVLEDSTGYCHGAQNYPLLKEALKALETGELQQDFDRESARQFYIRQIGLDPENPDDLKQIMVEYSEEHDPRRGIKITEILYTDEVKAQKAMLEHQYTSRELDALNIEDLKKIALAKGAKVTGKKEEVAAAILQSQGKEKEALSIPAIFDIYTTGYSKLSFKAVTYLSDLKVAMELQQAIPEISAEDAKRLAPTIRGMAEKKYRELEEQEVKAPVQFGGSGAQAIEKAELFLVALKKYNTLEELGQQKASVKRLSEQVPELANELIDTYEERYSYLKSRGKPARGVLSEKKLEDYYYGTKVTVEPEFEKPYDATIKRLLNNGELVEVHPDWVKDPQVSNRIPIDRVYVYDVITRPLSTEELRKKYSQAKKEIWQMTQREFNSTKVEKWQGIQNDETKTITGGYLFVLLDEPKQEGEWVTKSTGHSIRDVSNRSQAVAKFHKEQVEKALSEGKPVPEVVLKEYPELVKPKEEKKLYRYYYSHRPPGIGTQPDNPVRTERWVLRSKTPLGFDAFGWAEYDRPLTNDELKHFELFVDEPVMPKLVKELVQFAHDEGIDEAMKAITPEDEYYRAVMAWLKAIGREKPHVHPMAQVRDEVMRLAGIEKEKSAEWKEAEKILGISFDDYELYGYGTRIKAKKRYGDTSAEDYIIISKHLALPEFEKVRPFLKGIEEARIEPQKPETKPTDAQAIHKRAKEVAEWWFNSQMKNPFTEFYLYHKVGDFRVAIETPEGYKLSDAQRISPAWTKEQAEQWIYNTAQRLPILPLIPVAPLPLYSPRAEPTYKELIRTQEIKGWTVKYKFEWQPAMNYYSGFIWVNRGIGEGIRTAIITIKSADEIPNEIDKAIAEAERATQKPAEQPKDKFAEIQAQMQRDRETISAGYAVPLESADALYKRYTSGYSYVSLLGIVQQDIKGLAHSIGYELKLNTAIYTPAALLQYAEKFKEFAQRDYDIEHKKHEARKEKEQAEKEKEKREGGEAFWNEVKDLKVIDFEVQHDVNPDRPTRTYFHVYDRTIATLENGKRVQISYVINKGEYGKRALKATKEYYMKMYGQYMGKPLSNWITYDQLMIGNRYEEYLAQKPIRIEVLERFPTKSFLEPKIREYGKWIRENTYGEAGVRRLQTGSWEEVIATLKEFIRKYYNLAPAPADYIFRRPAYQQTEIGIDNLATSFFNVAANGWDLAETFKEWEAGETRQEWDRRLKEPEKPRLPIIKPVVKPEERILGELRTKYRFSRPEGDMVAKAIDSYIKIRDKSAVLAILSPVRDGKFIADDLIAMVEGTYWLKKEAPVPVPQPPVAKVPPEVKPAIGEVAKAVPALDLKIGDKVEVFGEDGRKRGTGEVLHVGENFVIVKDEFSKLPIKYNFAFEFRRILTEIKPEAPVPAPQPSAAKVQSIQETMQQVMSSIQAAKSVEELQPVLKGIGFLPLPDAEKRQVMDLYQNKYSILASERPFGAPIKAEEKPRVIGAPTPQELAEAELRRKAEEGKKLRGQVELGGAVTTAARLGLFEPGAMEKAKAEVEARRRIEQLKLPYTIHPVIKRLAESKEYILKFGAVTGKETLEDTILSRYKSYCPAGVIVDNKGARGQLVRWWVYPERLRTCIAEVQQKIAAAAVPAGVTMVKESTLSPSMRNYIREARAVRDVIHYFMDRRPPVRGILYRARDGTYFVEAQDGGMYVSMGWVDISQTGMPAAGATA